MPDLMKRKANIFAIKITTVVRSKAVKSNDAHHISTDRLGVLLPDVTDVVCRFSDERDESRASDSHSVAMMHIMPCSLS